MQNAGFGGPRATVELKFMNRGDKMHEFSNCGHRFDARENLPSMERVISNVRDFTTHGTSFGDPRVLLTRGRSMPVLSGWPQERARCPPETPS